MAILKIARLGNPILRNAAKPLSPKDLSSSEVQRLIRDMIETMRENEGVGLAAPQVHGALQIMVIEELRENNPKGKPTALTVLVNPVLTAASERQVEEWEGCLSIPDMRGLVPRYQEIKVQALDPTGRTLSFHARDFFARVIQHEHDHLLGKVFLERMRSLESLSYLKEYSKYWQKHEE
jgi:peptide deformylase